MKRTTCLLAVLFLLAGIAAAQESRGTIVGHVKDVQGGVVANAAVVVTNAGTNASVRLTTNETGYYQAVLLMPGQYTVTAEAPGFKKSVHSGITLLVGDRREVDVTLEVGAIADSITVTSEPPLIDASRTDSGRQLDERTTHDLPTMANSVVTILQYSPGVQSGGPSSLLGPHSTQGGSDYTSGAYVGGNSWTLDGAINDSKYSGGRVTTAMLPSVDIVSETKVLTTTFEGSFGHSTGIGLSMMTKSGSNQFHGTASDQHWQQRWQASHLFTKQTYYNKIAAANAAGNTALAQQLASLPIQPSGHSNNYAMNFTGPVWIPKIFNGRDKLFFSFSYNGERDKKPEDTSNTLKNVPTAANKKGDFSDLLQIAANPAQYQLYDPLSVKNDPARSGHVIRTVIPGNILPPSYIAMGKKVYDNYVKYWPDPNNRVSSTSPLDNDLNAVTSPYNWIFNQTSGRLDYLLGQRQRFFARYTDNTFKEYRGDWTSDIVRGFNNFVQTGSGVNRYDQNGIIDWVFTVTPRTIVHASSSVSNWSEEGAVQPFPFSVKPSSMGLPSYLDTKCGSACIAPFMAVGIASNSATTPGYYSQNGVSGYPAPTYYRYWMQNADVYHTRGNHSLRFGLDFRKQVRSGHTGNSGTYTFANTFFRQYDDSPSGYAASQIGLSWASFMMGLPTALSYSGNDNYIVDNPYYAWFAQDTWRLTPKLTLTLSLRSEWETGATERFNRLITGFDPNAALPIASAVQAAYAAKTAAQMPQLPASQFIVKGGTLYAGAPGAPGRSWGSQLMWLPRIGFGYQINSKTVIRGGYGVYYDAVNVMQWGPDQSGYSQATTTTVSPDGQGVTWNAAWNPAGGVVPISDPFPSGAASDGGRFLAPLKTGLGLLAKAGSTWTIPFEKHARQQRWRIGVERQLASHDVIAFEYEGTFASGININVSQSAVPSAYYNFDTTRTAAATAGNALMTTQVDNPYYYGNADYSSIANSNPTLYNWMKQQGMFNGTKRTIAQLIVPYSFTNLTLPEPWGYARSQMATVNFTHRFYHGLTANIAWTGMVTKAATGYFNNWSPTDPTNPQAPYWVKQNASMPNRVIATWVYDLPFGKGRKWVHNTVLDLLAGGWTLAGSYLYQPGQLLSFTGQNMFYYGDVNNINTVPHTLGQWFNNAGCVASTALAPGDTVVGSGACTSGFEKRSSSAPVGYQARAFPQIIDGLRGMGLHHWNGSVKRDFKIKERVTFQARVDALNVLNHSYFANPVTNPTDGNFGKITGAAGAPNRFLQITGRLNW